MHPLLRQHPEYVRLLRSGQAALPVSRDFWGDLARGLGWGPEELAGAVRSLQEAGIVEGVWGEPNPARGENREAVFFGGAADSAAKGGIVRWRGPGIVSVMNGPASGGWESGRWYKVGRQAEWPENAEEPQLITASRDRTPLVRENDLKPAPELSPAQAKVFASLSHPRRLDPGTNPYVPVAEAAGIGEDEARQAIGQLIIGTHWRRFGLCVDLRRAGWEGCGLAAWDLSAEDAPRAAAALAPIVATGDVCLRTPTTEAPFRVAALIQAPGAGQGRRAAEEISAKWGRKLEGWWDV